ncbi:CYT protein, partial [Atractosteus spatula]|nr:CYT protein [Atractosteus spatula]
MSGLLRFLLPIVVATLSVSAAPEPISTSDPGARRAANYAMQVHNELSKNEYAFRIVRIESASFEMFPPSRVEYFLTAEVGRTVCRNEQGLNPSGCALQSGADAKTVVCRFVVLAVPNSSVPSHLLEDQCQE